MTNLVIPMAGSGSRFVDSGYKTPKPFIDVNGQPMIEKVIRNLYRPGMHLYLIARSEHVANYSHVLDAMCREFEATILTIDHLTAGTVCTVLLAEDHINNETPLVIANSDQIVDFDVEDFLVDCIHRDLDGSILVFRDAMKDPKWSFAKTDARNLVTEVREKQPISEFATVGVYLFSRGYQFVASAKQMIKQSDTVNGEYYTCPVYNHLLQAGGSVGIYEIPENAMHGLGTPEDLKKYIGRLSVN